MSAGCLKVLRGSKPERGSAHWSVSLEQLTLPNLMESWALHPLPIITSPKNLITFGYWETP